MSATSVRLPESLHRKVKELAARDNVSMNQPITVALAERLSALETEDYLAERAGRATKAEFGRALKAVPDVEPEPYDRVEGGPTASWTWRGQVIVDKGPGATDRMPFARPAALFNRSFASRTPESKAY
jgi:hypothetical protein